MKLNFLLAAAFAAVTIAAPVNGGFVKGLDGGLVNTRDADLDERVAYPDEQLYAEEYKRSPHSADEDVLYPDEQLYAEEYKRGEDMDERIAYPDEQLYA